MKNNTINSIKAMFDRKKNRSGYNTDTLFIVKSFKDILSTFNNCFLYVSLISTLVVSPFEIRLSLKEYSTLIFSFVLLSVIDSILYLSDSLFFIMYIYDSKGIKL